MANTPNIKSFTTIRPMIYAYQTPTVPAHDGWTKIGYTATQSVADRINQQSHTINVPTALRWSEPAMYMDGSFETFTDHDFHRYLMNQRHVERTPGTEWFHIAPDPAHDEFTKFSHRDYEITEGSTYTLRDEQAAAVEKTQRYFESGGTDFLWNAKPRFGKTLTAYDLVHRMGFTKVLIVTNRPSISDSWLNDFQTFIGWQYPYLFVSDNKNVLKEHARLGKHANEGVMTRADYMAYLNSLDASSSDDYKGMIAFESLQGLKTSKYFSGHNDVDKLEWISKLNFDLLIVDESQEGVDTALTEKAFDKIHRKHTLYLSGTPFKALAQGRFSDDQIFNWTYVDEQEAKQANADGENSNPYEVLPRMEMYTYRMSDMITSKIREGVDVDDDGENEDYAFDLNEFFATKRNGTFVHEDSVKEFLHNLTTLEKYPFSTPELRAQLSHTLWILNRVASCKALAKLIEAEPAFEGYKVVVAAGDGKLLTDDEGSFVNADDADKTAATALERVKEAIANNPRTITLSVGQLTVGVTIPEWSGVLMLCNLKSASSYMQAAFRAQNPCTITTEVDGKPQLLRKETAYVFDFDPVRTLSIVEEFAENLSHSDGTASGGGKTAQSRQEQIKRLLNFFPVIGEDDEGRMVQLDAEKVMSIPRKIKSQEVVKRRFLCNFLFQNIAGIFGAPAEVREILNKLEPAKEEKPSKKDRQVKPADFTLDENGKPEIPDDKVAQKEREIFSDKIFTLDPSELPQMPSASEIHDLLDDEGGASGSGMSDSLIDTSSYTSIYEKAAADQYSKDTTSRIVESLDVPEKDKKRIAKCLDKSGERVIHESIGKAQQEFDERQQQLQQSYQQDASNAETPQERTAVQQKHADAMQSAFTDFITNLGDDLNAKLQEERRKAVAEAQRMEAERKKREIEDTVREHLRGFTRTVPSFVMAYGDRNLTLRNFDDYTEDDVFHEVTGITEDEFRFLRDGGDYVDEETGETKHYAGHVFDETVFNDAIQEFLNKKEQLANYFDDSQTEDIFDYIPPQKTNQIFTPRWVVEKMVDELEQENPGCFDNPDATFADLYMKSGMYIAEIVKRLYRSERMKQLFPDGGERIRHIFEHQVYGMAPSRIIYLIATNYILGFNDQLKSTGAHFVQADAAEAAKDGTLQQLVDEKFGA